MQADAPLIVHLTYRLAFGGLENLLVERINRIAPDRYRHMVVCLTDFTDFAQKIQRPGVEVVALHKPAGLALGTHLALYRLLRRVKPAILHTYNLSAIEYAPVAMLAGVGARVNGAHGREASDPYGTNRKHNLLRKLMLPFYDICYANSGAMEVWNREVIGVPARKSAMLPNGIDAERFRVRAPGERSTVMPFGPECFVVGTVGRVQDVKDQAGLIDAFLLLHERYPQLRLAIVGDGPLLEKLRAKVQAAGIADKAWLPGARNDIPDILRGYDVFALPSLAEGTPGSALEAMATGLPVVGSRVGGIPEVVDDGNTGLVVPPSDPAALAAALERYLVEPGLAQRHGTAGLERMQRKYSMQAMVAAYTAVYDQLCERKYKLRRPVTSCVE